MSTYPTGILLAAGQSRRFGANKLLHPLSDGTPLAVACARTLHTVLAHCIAVVDDSGSDVAQMLAAEGLQVVTNACAREGMGTSIACGVGASPESRGWIIALADMQDIPVDIVQSVAAGLARGTDIIAPVCGGRRGHPVGFAPRHSDALRALHVDRGARDIIAAHRESLVLVDTPDTGVLRDIDTPASLGDSQVADNID